MTGDEPDNTAVRVAMWRALHVAIDPPPHVLVDEIGLQLAAPDEGWQRRPDMDPVRTSRNRASIVARARFTDDLVAGRVDDGVDQYVILGAGLDTFAQRRDDLLDRLAVYEIDRPGTQRWKQGRLDELGLPAPSSLHFVPVDFESGASWRDALDGAGFDAARPAVVTSSGVAVYLTRETVVATLRDVAALAEGTTLAMSFMVPFELLDADELPALQGAARGAQAGGTPWLSFFTPADIVDLARSAGFRDVRHVDPTELSARWFADRPDGLRPSGAEHLLLATV
ncbi:MAG: class I SAM-dependent methyltransferase [Actinobacteria bacterium]|nr:class I SAM-dependent methyltransferase [Actinomycetota bacterium]